MLNLEKRTLATSYLDLKQGISILNNNIMAGAPRAPVPHFDSPSAAANYYFYEKGNPYTGDPLWGAGDIYIDPRRIQAAFEAGPDAVHRLYIDCDDVAGWYLLAVRQMQGHRPRIMTLIDEHIFGSHVICIYEGPAGYGALDTNGLTLLPDLDEATLCRVWSGIYAGNGYRYIAALPTPYPF